MPDDISFILSDRESGSVALLNRLIAALEIELQGTDPDPGDFRNLLNTIREKLRHFAAIENFLVSLMIHAVPENDFPGEPLNFIKEYRQYWRDSAGKIAGNFLRQYNPEGRSILTHSHSQTVISLLGQLHERGIPFRVLQTLSSPGEEGKKSLERLHELKIRADLIDDEEIKDAFGQADLVLMGCDALLDTKFLNKTGTRAILQLAKQCNKPSFLVTESRKEITHSEWERGLTYQPLFEWVPLDLADSIITEKRV